MSTMAMHTDHESGMRMISIREALREALTEEMERDENIFLMGEEVGHYNGAYKVSQGLLQQFGERRVIDTPISENGFAGIGIGAAMNGLRPIIEFMTWNFALQAIDQIVNNAAKTHLMTAGTYNVPITFRGPNGPAHMLSAQHSQAMESMYVHWPGLVVVSYSCPADAKGLLKSSIRHNDPVCFLESELNYAQEGPVPSGEYLIPLGKGEIKRPGKDVTIIAWQKMVGQAQKAAEIAKAEFNLEVEILDPRTLKPLDEELIIESVKKTNRVVIVEEGHQYASMGSYIAERIAHACFDYLDAPIERVCSLETPMPYAESLEEAVLPRVPRIIDAIRKVCYV
jgi:pyruvate dehydrogenase E1 component beta subunit